MALETRHVHLLSSLPPEQLLLQRARVTEELGRPFTIDLELLSPDPLLKLDDVLGDRMTVALSKSDELRYFNGHVARFGQGGTLGRYTRYVATLRPHFWLLSLASDCRIYKKLTVPGIIKQVVQEFGLGTVEEKLQGTYLEREYTVQYRETYFDFLSRLLEEEGIYYFFRHEKDKHVMVLADDRGSLKPAPGAEKVPFIDPEKNANPREEHFSEWTIVQEVQTAAYVVNDFDFVTPRADLKAKLSKPLKHKHAQLEQYDPIAGYVDALDAGGSSQAGDRGSQFARVRLEELQADHDRAVGLGNVRALFAGALFELTEHPRDDQNRELLVVRAEYSMFQPGFDAGSSVGQDKQKGKDAKDEVLFETRVTVQPSKLPFRPHRMTPLPQIPGPHTALVVGPGEIATDKYGRVKVHFPWDRHDTDGCWIRVAQAWAGAGWGGLHIPRVGQEVIVEFIEGDPDRPIITGRVYNGTNAPPFGLPDGATKSGILSRSSKGGSADHANEIRLEDKKGEEQLFFHAEKNMDSEVENDQTLKVGHDRRNTIENDQAEEIKGNKKIKVHKNHDEEILQNMSLKVIQSEQENIGGNRTIDVGGSHSETIGTVYNVTVGAASALTVGAAAVTTVGAAYALSVGGPMTQDVGASLSMSAANNTTVGTGDNLSVTAGKEVAIEVGAGMTLHVSKDVIITVDGAHKTTVTKALGIEADEITIEAKKKLTLKAGDATIVLDNGKIEIKGSKVQAKSDGDMILKGSKIAQN